MKSKAILFFFVCLLGFVIWYKWHKKTDAVNEDFPAQITFIDSKNRFAVSLPSKPTEKDDLFTTREGYSIQIIQNSNFKAQITKGKIIYADERTDATGTKFMDYKTLDGNTVYQGRMFLINGSIYMLLYKSLSNNIDQDGFNTFISSFQINQ